MVKNPLANAGDTGSIPGSGRSREGYSFLEKEMATRSSVLAWEIPWMEKSDGLQSMKSQESLTQLSN